MTPERLLLLLFLLQFKHLLADYVWQSGWMVQNKGHYGRLGGIAHAGLHAVLTYGVLLVMGFDPMLSLALSFGEFVVHYHVDWTKDQITRWRKVTASQKEYWIYAGIDQFAHQVTLIAVIMGLLWWG